jgi:hypothetical protein
MLEEQTLDELSPERVVAVRKHLHHVLSSDAFKGGKRAQDFLQLVVEHALAGRLDSLRERMLGAEMFGRPIDYDTANDAVVRVKASEVRRRLARYYDGLDSPSHVRIGLMTGSYIPQFHWTSAEDSSTPAEAAEPAGPTVSNSDSVGHSAQLADAPSATQEVAPRFEWKRWLVHASFLAVFSAVLISLTWFAAIRFGTARQHPNPADPFWTALFDEKRSTFIVPADAGFNLLEDISHRSIPLAEYVKGSYLSLPLAGLDPHSAEDLHSGKYGSFIDFQIIACLARLPQYNPQRTIIRFARDLRIDDLKDANAILLGSVGSNPWASIAESGANFRIVYRQGMEGATITNGKPQPGESAAYESHWNEPEHETFALISFLPNVGGNGHLLLLQGLDSAGTQAAAEVLFYSSELVPILERAKRPDGTLRYFEVLVRSTSIDSSSAGTTVIATRIY